MKSDIKLSKFDDVENIDLTLFKYVVGSLTFITCTRPDILFAVRVISLFMKTPTSTHLNVSRRIYHYLNGRINYGLVYSPSDDLNLVGYYDSNYTEDVDRKNTFEFVFFLSD